MLLNHLLEDIPHFRSHSFDHSLRALDVVGVPTVDEALHDKRLEELQRHVLGQAALVHLELRAHDDDRTPRVVDTLAEQVLAEPPLLAFEHVGQRLERAVARACYRAASAAVVDERIDGLLEHPLLVAHDDVRSAQFEEPLQPVVPVDDPAIKVVKSEVANRPPSSWTIGLSSGGMTGMTSMIIQSGDFPTDGTLPPLPNGEWPGSGAGPKLPGSPAQLVSHFLEIHLFEKALDRLCAHARLKGVAVLLPILAILFSLRSWFFASGVSPGSVTMYEAK